jgi:hypothetical protein
MNPNESTGETTERKTIPLKDLIRQVDGGDESALATLRDYLDENPDFWQKEGDLTTFSIHQWLDLLRNNSRRAKAECIRRHLEELKAELAPTSPLEKLLVDQIVLTKLHSAIADWLHFGIENNAKVGPAEVRVAVLWQESAHRRHLMSIKQLAVVRKLLKPSISRDW